MIKVPSTYQKITTKVKLNATFAKNVLNPEMNIKDMYSDEAEQAESPGTNIYVPAQVLLSP